MKTKDPLIVEFCTFFLQTDDFRRYSFYPWELTALFLRFWWEKDIPRLQTHHNIQHKQSSPTFSNHHVLGCVFIFQGSWFSKMISVSHFMWHSIWHLFSWMTRWLAFHGREVKVCWCIGCFAWSSWGTPKSGCGGPKPSKCGRCFDLDVVDVFSIFFWCDLLWISPTNSQVLRREGHFWSFYCSLQDAAAAAQLCADKITALPNDATVPGLPPELLTHSYCWHSRMSSTPKFRGLLRMLVFCDLSPLRESHWHKHNNNCLREGVTAEILVPMLVLI